MRKKKSKEGQSNGSLFYFLSPNIMRGMDLFPLVVFLSMVLQSHDALLKYCPLGRSVMNCTHDF